MLEDGLLKRGNFLNKPILTKNASALYWLVNFSDLRIENIWDMYTRRKWAQKVLVVIVIHKCPNSNIMQRDLTILINFFVNINLFETMYLNPFTS